MVSFTVRMTFRPEDREAIEGFLHELAPASRKEPGCVTYIPHWVEGEAATLVIYEQYRDEAALDQHRASPHFVQFAKNGLYLKLIDRRLENLKVVA